jgi:hypothetical protein
MFMTRILYTEVKSGERLVATDITDLTFFPRGTILPFSSAAWDETSSDFKKIWKICDGQNGTINLVGRFIRGGAYANYGATGGTDDQTLSANNIPSHTHGFSTSTAELTGELNVGQYVSYVNATGVFTSWSNGSPENNSNNAGARVKIDVTHSHTGTTNNQNGKTNGTATASFDNRPAFTTLIFIQKMA